MLEKEIENQILHYLMGRGVMAFKVERQGTFDPRKGIYRKKTGLWKKGVSDIIGIYKKRPLAIEVKSDKGRLSPDQNDFILEWRSEGGFAFVARSVDDVIKNLIGIDGIIERGTEVPQEQIKT